VIRRRSCKTKETYIGYAKNTEITKLTKLDSFSRAAESSSSAYQCLDTTTLYDISRLDSIQNDDVEQAATVLVETVSL